MLCQIEPCLPEQILCMSGNKIYMDYGSALGPIDPQVFNEDEKEWVPALGYLDQVDKMIEKSAKNLLTEAELLILQTKILPCLANLNKLRI